MGVEEGLDEYSGSKVKTMADKRQEELSICAQNESVIAIGLVKE